MRSSISNSKTTPLQHAIIVFGVTFGFCVAGGLMVCRGFPTEAWKGSLPSVPSDDRYIVMEAYSDQAFDLYQMYYGIGGSIQEAQKADVLILGNSKPFFAFRDASVKVFAQKTGIKIFNLAGPYGDNLALAKAFLDKFHLSPKVLIVNENHFFSQAFSPYGEETIKMGYWQAWVKTAEHEVSWFIRSHLHRVFPRFGLGKIYGSTPVVEYRAERTGCLAMENFTENLVPVADIRMTEERLSKDEIGTAIAFKKDMEARGTRIVLTSVPYGTDDIDHLEKWIVDPERRVLVGQAEEPYEKIDETARQLGLPFIVVKPAGMVTFDGRHLDGKSASEFAELFFEQFFNRPEIQSVFKAGQ